MTSVLPFYSNYHLHCIVGIASPNSFNKTPPQGETWQKARYVAEKHRLASRTTILDVRKCQIVTNFQISELGRGLETTEAPENCRKQRTKRGLETWRTSETHYWNKPKLPCFIPWLSSNGKYFWKARQYMKISTFHEKATFSLCFR